MDAFLILLALAAVVVGGLIYIVHRTETLLMFQWFRTLGVIHPVEAVRAALADLPTPDFCKRLNRRMIFLEPANG